ncbi:hypothetical protein B7Y94_03330 [Candidatus Saccharibacteria bacterium 32-49-12]|nr:MAG: hypothetical protein B7Y94_03330 [Candidatus Saccharibacteria bacterium 32-49-12]
MVKLTWRGWLTIVTLILLTLVVIGAWPEIVSAWNMLDQVNLWILALLVPLQFISYYITGEIMFTYLRGKGHLYDMSRLKMTRTALELNFVNHVLPSGGAAGFSYFGWVLSRYGVRAGRATMSQIIRYALTFVTFVILLVVAVIVLIADHQMNRTTILLSFILTLMTVGGMIGLVYVIGNQVRIKKVARFVARTANRLVSFFTAGRRQNFVKSSPIEDFFDELHDDYLAIKRDKKLLRWPFIWAFVANIFDAILLWVAFGSLGYWLNPAILFIAWGVASSVSALSVTPGGAGVYETIMIAVLASAGVKPDVAIAGTLLARIALLMLTIVFGYVFYQFTIAKYGKRPPISQ